MRQRLGIFQTVMSNITRNLSHNIRRNGVYEVYRLNSLSWKGDRYSNNRTFSLSSLSWKGDRYSNNRTFSLSSLSWKGDRYSYNRTFSLYLWKISALKTCIIQELIIHYTRLGLPLYSVTGRRAVQAVREPREGSFVDLTLWPWKWTFK